MKQILDKLLKRPPQQPLKDQLRKQLAEVDRMREELDRIVKTACDKAFLKEDIS